MQRAQPPTPVPCTTRRVPGDGRVTGYRGLQPRAPGDGGQFTAGPPHPRSLQRGGGRLTDPPLQGWGGCGFGSRGLAVLQRAALVVHAAALERAQQIEEALLVGRRGPGDALRAGRCSRARSWGAHQGCLRGREGLPCPRQTQAVSCFFPPVSVQQSVQPARREGPCLALAGRLPGRQRGEIQGSQCSRCCSPTPARQAPVRVDVCVTPGGRLAWSPSV